MADIEKINRLELVSAELISDLRRIIDSARSHVAATANYELTMMYWHIGNRINRDVLNNERAEYGQQIVSMLATKLFWSHFMEVLPLKDDVAREFYITIAANERWSIKRLRKEIDGMLYERTAIATKPEELIKSELANLRDNKIVPDKTL